MLDIDLLGQADPVRRELQDAQLAARANRSRRPQVLKAVNAQPNTETAAVEQDTKSLKSPEFANDWMRNGDFASSDALADLIVSPKASNKKAR